MRSVVKNEVVLVVLSLPWKVNWVVSATNNSTVLSFDNLCFDWSKI